MAPLISQTVMPISNSRKRGVASTPNPQPAKTPKVASTSKRGSTPVPKAATPLVSITHPTTPGTVLACGQGDTGQLGLGPDITERKRLQPVKLPGPMIQAFAGGMHSVCLSADGKVFTFGCNDESALGRATQEEEESFIPGEVMIEGAKKIVQISAGDSHSAALDEEGSVFVWGVFRDSQGILGISSEHAKPITTPFKLPGISDIVKIASGDNHLVMLSSSGEVYSVGSAEQGELGRVSRYQSEKGGRRGISSILEPQVVHFRSRIKMCDIWCNGYNSFFKSTKGDLYSCGLNNYQQTGTLSDSNSVYVPSIVKALKGVEVSKVAGGSHHCMFLDTSGKVHVLGRGDLGRLGIGSEPDFLSEIQTLESFKSPVKEIACGTCVSYAITEEGDLYAWGMGTNHQLGLGEDDDQVSPEHVMSKQLEDKKAIQVTSGGQHTLCIVV